MMPTLARPRLDRIAFTQSGAHNSAERPSLSDRRKAVSGASKSWVRAACGLGLCVLLAFPAGCRKKPDPPTVRVGSKNTTEQVLLGEIIAAHLERRLPGVRIERQLALGGTAVLHQALISGQVDLYPEYSAAALSSILRLPPSNDPASVREQVRQNYSYQFQVAWMSPLGFESNYVAVVRKPAASEQGLRTLTEASRRRAGWIIGAGYEFLTRSDGYPLLMQCYSLPVKPPIQTPEPALLYSALREKQVEIAFGYSTDGLLDEEAFTVLQDDKRCLLPGEAAIAVRRDAMERIPGLSLALHQLSRRFSTEMMRRWNREIEAGGRRPGEVAQEALASLGLP